MPLKLINILAFVVPVEKRYCFSSFPLVFYICLGEGLLLSCCTSSRFTVQVMKPLSMAEAEAVELIYLDELPDETSSSLINGFSAASPLPPPASSPPPPSLISSLNSVQMDAVKRRKIAGETPVTSPAQHRVCSFCGKAFLLEMFNIHEMSCDEAPF